MLATSKPTIAVPIMATGVVIALSAAVCNAGHAL
jgi:hypothetical protein